MVAVVTVLGGLETFFNWRSRLNRLRDAMDYYLVATPSGQLSRAKVDESAPAGILRGYASITMGMMTGRRR